MRPLRLRLKGFTAFRDEQTIDFEGVEIFAIAGPTGAGKSSLLDAMTYALYGEVDRVNNQCAQLVSQGLPRMAVTLDFRVGSDDYRITRTTARAGQSTVLFERIIDGQAQSVGEGADRVRDVKELVKSVVGLDYDAFTRSVLLPQNKFAELLTGDPRKRREILIDLLGLSLFNDMAKRAGQIGREAERDAASLDAVVTKEYAGVDEASLNAAKKDEREKVERQGKIAAAHKRVREIAEEAETDRRAASDLAGCADEAATLADQAEAASKGLAEMSKKVADADRRVADKDAGAKKLDTAHKVATDARTKAEKKWGTLSTVSELKAQAQSLVRLQKAADSADATAERSQARRPKVEKHQSESETALAAASKDAKAAEDAVKAAKERLGEVEHADRVAAIAAGLKKGDPCPVCGQPLLAAPKPTGGSLREARAALKTAEMQAEAARDVLAEAKVAKSEADKDLKRLDDEIRDLRAKSKEAAAELLSARRDVALAFAGKIPEDPVAALQDRVDQLKELDSAERKARDDAADAERALTDARRARDALDTAVVKERTRLEIKPDALFDRCRKLGIAAASLPKLVALPPQAKGIDPAVVAGRDLATALRSLADLLTGEADRRTKTQKTLLAHAARAAEVIAPRADTLDALVEELADAERAAVRLATEAKQRAQDLEERLQHRRQMEAEIETKTRRARVLGVLALELRADHIIAFLQGEALEAMAAAASLHLAELSDDRYRLVCRDDDFLVIDGWTGDEERSVRTLSGGETFLASLALALGLAEQVRALSVSPRARLDSLFLDEGFGSLDADTLETATNAIERLAGDGRLVGVITHLTALSDQFTRIEVIKTPKGSSTLRFISWPRSAGSGSAVLEQRIGKAGRSNAALPGT
ncbi:MAG TPA: SMC family ATPase [Candidatus Limnocylindria bacterium]|nr:SMC family ATPase [Candidatus Limnocylindria bacterium]